MHRFNWVPVAGLGRHCEPKIKQVVFGDGYQQRAPDGINHALRRYSATFKEDAEVIRAIDDFLFDRGAVEAFLFVPFGEWQERVVLCKSWRVVENGLKGELSAVFEEVVK